MTRKRKEKIAVPKRTNETASRGWKILVTTIGFIVAFVGFASAVGYFWPRIAIDADGKFDAESPFPASVNIINTGNIPLIQLSVRVRPAHIESAGGSKLIGSPNGPGGITTPDWKISRLEVGDKWTVPMGRNVSFFFGPVTNGDLSVVVNFWPWPIPKPSFIDWSKEARLVTHRDANGEISWIARPR